MGLIAGGRAAFDRQAWGEAYSQLAAADEQEPLEVDDLERLAASAYLIGRDQESFEVWGRAHHECARRGDVPRAVRGGFWIAFGLLNKGELGRGGGWVDRGQRLLDEAGLDCAEQAYLRYAVGLRAVFQGDLGTAYPAFSEAADLGVRFGDRELTTLARIGAGRCLIYMGEVSEGVALLDEAMVAVSAREVSPIATGDAYCTVIEGCSELFEIGRVQEWTTALSQWCDAQPDLVLYRGQCLLHRAEIMHFHGAWREAAVEVDRACRRLAQPSHPALGAAMYLRAELHRLRGEHAQAEEAYAEANDLGRPPQPGLALLRLAQGRRPAAVATIRRVLDEAEDPFSRARLLGPYVEIMLAAGDVASARLAADELGEVAKSFGAPFLRALAAHVQGMVLLAEADPRSALVSLRRAWTGWRELEAAYEAAQVRVLIARACQALGDEDGAKLELSAARAVFVSLEAQPDVAALDRLSRPATTAAPGGLTTREVEILVLLATGRTNRAIATELVISEKTVASHVNHIFTKLGLSSRAAATAYAYQHGLVREVTK